jgi:hypothetical protein
MLSFAIKAFGPTANGIRSDRGGPQEPIIDLRTLKLDNRRTGKEGDVRSVRSAWRTDVGRLTCRWEATELQSPYCPPWMGDASTAFHEEVVSPLILALDFTRLSSFAGKGWFERMLGGLISLGVPE